MPILFRKLNLLLMHRLQKTFDTEDADKNV